MYLARRLPYLILPLVIIKFLISVKRDYFLLRAKPIGNLEEADVFIGLGFGIVRVKSGCDQPGNSNMALAEWLLKYNPQRKPAIIQQGIHLALKELGEEDLDDWVIVLPDRQGIHVDTRATMLQCWALMDKEKYHLPAIICMPLQATRATWIANKIFSKYVMPSLPELPYDRHSTQLWTRSFYNYMIFELLIARPIGFLFGWFELRSK